MSIESDVYKILRRWNRNRLNLYQLNMSVKEIVEYIEKLMEVHGKSLNTKEDKDGETTQNGKEETRK